MVCLFPLEIIRSRIGSCFGRYDSRAYGVQRLVCAYLQLTFQPPPPSSSPPPLSLPFFLNIKKQD